MLLGIYTKVFTQTYMSTENLHIGVYTALFLIAKSWKQSRCPSGPSFQMMDHYLKPKEKKSTKP